MAAQFDRLKMFFGEPLDVGNGLKLSIPTIGDILRLPESDATFYQTLYVWIANPTMYRLMLWENGIDWNKITDYQLFLMLYKTSNPIVDHMMFGDVEIASFDLFGRTTIEQDEEGNEVEKTVPTLYNKNLDIEIQEKDYTLISEYLRSAFNIHPKVEKAKGKYTKEAIIEEERMNIEFRARNGEDPSNNSSLLPLISACVNHPGFKYKLEELRDVNFVQFMDSVQRLQIYENTTALLRGSMSGFVDTKNINKDEFNFMRDISSSK